MNDSGLHEQASGSNAPPGAAAKTQGPIEDIYPLTRMQHGILVRCVTYPDRPVYWGQWWAVLEGEIDEVAFAAAWRRVGARHPALRTGFNWELKDRPFQVVHRHAGLDVERIDWCGTADWRARLEAFLAADRGRPFDLKKPPLMRVRLVRLGPARHLIVWTRHHLVVDGWSLGAVLGEVLATYAAMRRKEELSGRPALPYRVYVEWQRGLDLATAGTHWRAALSGLDVDTATARPANPPDGSTPDIAAAVRAVEPAVFSRLSASARALRLTMSTVVHGAWALVLGRAAGCDDVLFGAVETVRPPQLMADRAADLIGMQIEVLPVRARIDDTPLAEWLARMQAAMVAGRAVGGIGLDAIRDMIGLPRGMLPFESLIGFQNYPLDANGPFAAAGLAVVESGDVTLPDMPLNLIIEPHEGLTLRLMVDQRHRSLPEADLLLDMLAATLRTMPDGMDRPVAAIDPAADVTSGMPADMCRGAPLAVPDQTVPEMIVAHAAAAPQAVAVRYGDRSMTYAGLVGTAFAVAARLERDGIGPGARVGVALERTPLAVAAILGVMLRGASYVPLDIAEPAERLAFMIGEASIAAVIAAHPHEDGIAGTRAIRIDDIDGAAPETPAAPRFAVRQRDEAYVVFTSGSTGKPKGVVVGHDNLRYHVAARAAAYPEHPVGVFLLTFPLVFDGSVTVLFCTLASGGTLVLPRPIEARDPDRLAALIRSADVTHTDMTPSLWSLVLAAAKPAQLASLRLSLVAGEACPRELVARHHAALPNVPLHNEYGPTEVTVWSSFDRCRADEAGTTVPIGRPIPGTSIYVVDRSDRLCPLGTIGELLIAGPGIARGYAGRDDLTAGRFTPNPFPHEPGCTTVYRTGDLASFGFDGRLRFHGRADHQVKVDGYRIELGEIEARLCGHTAVSEAVVVLRQDGAGRPGHIVAHVAGRNLPDEESLREHVQRALPRYMVPQAIVKHDALPRTAAGKVDREHLPAPSLRTASEPPAGKRECAIAAIWCAVLAREAVGRHDDFFTLGGTSLTAMQIVSRMRRELKLAVALTDLFEAPRVADLARLLDARAPTVASDGPALRRVSRTRVELPRAPGGGPASA
jgi:amino acid adenylation domain-containing protein